MVDHFRYGAHPGVRRSEGVAQVAPPSVVDTDGAGVGGSGAGAMVGGDTSGGAASEEAVAGPAGAAGAGARSGASGTTPSGPGTVEGAGDGSAARADGCPARATARAEIIAPKCRMLDVGCILDAVAHPRADRQWSTARVEFTAFLMSRDDLWRERSCQSSVPGEADEARSFKGRSFSGSRPIPCGLRSNSTHHLPVLSF